MISWLYPVMALILLGGGVAFLIAPSQLSIIIGVVNFFLLIAVFVRIRQLLKWHEKIFGSQSSSVDEEAIKALINLEEERK